MTPATRLLRHLLLLPVSEAEHREQEIAALSAELNAGKQKVNFATDRMRARSADLRAAYDELLGKLE